MGNANSQVINQTIEKISRSMVDVTITSESYANTTANSFNTLTLDLTNANLHGCDITVSQTTDADVSIKTNISNDISADLINEIISQIEQEATALQDNGLSIMDENEQEINLVTL